MINGFDGSALLVKLNFIILYLIVKQSIDNIESMTASECCGRFRRWGRGSGWEPECGVLEREGGARTVVV